MKIVFVSDVIYPYVKGGAEKRIYEIARRLVARGHEVHVFGVKWWDGGAVQNIGGITYHGVCGKKDLYVGGRRSIFEAIWFAICLSVPLARERFDVIDCNQHPYFPLFVCKAIAVIKGKRFLATWHEYWGDYWYEYLWGVKGFVGRTIEKWGARMPDRIIAVSDRTAHALRSSGLPGQKVLVVSNGIPYRHIREIPPAAEKCDVLFAGRLIKDKHIDVLLRACSLAGKPIRLSILGDGPERDSLEKLARELGIEATTEFAGFLEEGELMARMKAARLFVLPSSREGFSITTLEAMACGLPVITVDCEKNYATDLIAEGQTGLVVRLDAKEISEAIVSLLDDEPGRSRMSVECVTATAAYDWDLLVGKLEQAYEGKPACDGIASDHYK
ncbi:glycosyltransferase family 4 protein [Methanocella arvoryzae]|uniref:Glycosyltransferase (Group 1) n=1 Tax=Methanocella arvoryzae (strain DSM 22066 / NBRC 105507 / MRE50) TaxID=351160 RepID=Q0W7G6_METAR|nr:glycosyltransferase family 4 protein [Methanocella arvoryzae]CAJ35677.1 glycosyltransferase (group 1) [Methanocella arvoryzae MRE50]